MLLQAHSFGIRESKIFFPFIREVFIHPQGSVSLREGVSTNRAGRRETE